MREENVESGDTIDEQGLPIATDTQTQLTLPFDAKKYLSFAEEFDLTLEEKIDLLHTLWKMMATFVDRAWGVDPVQLLPAFNEFSFQTRTNALHQGDIVTERDGQQSPTAPERTTDP